MANNNSSNVAKKIQGVIIDKVLKTAGLRISEIVEAKLDQVIDDVVYNGEFQPYGKNPYERRESKDGGFGDINMMETLPTINENTITLTTKNISVGAGDNVGERLDEIIEYGEKYEWEHIPPPRPVFETAKEEIKNSKAEIIEEIKNALK